VATKDAHTLTGVPARMPPYKNVSATVSRPRDPYYAQTKAVDACVDALSLNLTPHWERNCKTVKLHKQKKKAEKTKTHTP
jgi:hypothetical protein